MLARPEAGWHAKHCRLRGGSRCPAKLETDFLASKNLGKFGAKQGKNMSFFINAHSKFPPNCTKLGVNGGNLQKYGEPV